MSRTKWTTVVGIVGLVVIGAMIFPVNQAKAKSDCGGCGQGASKSKMSMDKNHMTKDMNVAKIYAQHMPMVSVSIEKAIKAIERGNDKVALAELKMAKNMITAMNAIIEAASKNAKPGFANSKCPIMGSPINTDKVAKNLIREYKDRKIAFCCGGCPAAWDKLSDKEKDAKLAKVKTRVKASMDHSGHSMH